jgi:hypothetical protein
MPIYAKKWKRIDRCARNDSNATARQRAMQTTPADARSAT